jgi:hypothetical protein
MSYLRIGAGEASIAVLPFTDLSPGQNQQYFTDGLAEELINDLAHVPGLKVVARSSAFEFRGKNEDRRFVGHKLVVAHILEGSVRKSMAAFASAWNSPLQKPVFKYGRRPMTAGRSRRGARLSSFVAGKRDTCSAKPKS